MVFRHDADILVHFLYGKIDNMHESQQMIFHVSRIQL